LRGRSFRPRGRQGRGLDFEFRKTDVASSKEVEALAAHAKDKFSTLDVLVNAAGIILGRHVLETTEEEWDLLHDANVKSAFLMTKAMAPFMRKGKASIVNISSVGGVIGIANMSAYGAAKAGIAHFSKACAVDLTPDIRVNAILPGLIDTPMSRGFIEALPEEQREAVWQGFAGQHLLNRVGEPEEVVSLIAYLASDEASFITGSAITVDGGWTTT
jgi:NAD(P)-dependent dehydrogenase (short-subunit alcohol dehydrogenase family)